MGLSDLFYNGGKQTDKYQVRVGSDDKRLIQGVFPETGIMTNLSVFMFAQLAEVLRDNGITTYSERVANGITIEDLKRMCTLSWQKKSQKAEAKTSRSRK